ncbi:MAG: DUF1579 domain-containing protein [Candidatus Eiseniibacteriota bacterium]
MNGSSKSFVRVFVFGVLCLALTAGGALADTQSDKDKAAAAAKQTAQTPPAMDAAMQAQMAEMVKLGTPGKPHEQLKAMEGTWNADVKSWMGPGEPTVSKGTMVNKMILGGRFLESRYSGKFLDQTFDGVGLTGYDNKKNEIITLWLDSMGTSWMMQNGKWSADGKEIQVSGTADGFDGKPTTFTSTTKVVDNNKHVYTMSTMMGGKDTPVMEITYTRASGTTAAGQ